MVKKYTTYRTLKKWVRILIKLIILVLFAVGIFLIITSLNLNAPIKEVLLTYDIEQNPKYKVNIFNNAYIDDTSLLENSTYISNLVSTIELRFDYIYEAIKPGNYEYNYNVKATIHGEYQGSVENSNTKVWTKKYTLIDNKKQKVANKNSFSISEDVELDFQKYNKEVLNFKEDLSVPINAYLEVIMNINVKGESNGNKVTDNREQKFKIPLNQIAFSISKEAKATDHKEIIHMEDNRSMNMIKFDIGIVMIVDSITLLILTFKLIFKSRHKTKFEIELEQILKSYGDIIVELVNNVDLREKQVVQVKSFNEMLDLEEELRIPINFIQTHKNIGEFFIVNNDICYKWYLKEK